MKHYHPTDPQPRDENHFGVEQPAIHTSSAATESALEVDDGPILRSLCDTHRSRAGNILTLMPMVPACAAEVFDALGAPTRSTTPSSHRFLSRLMRAAVDKAEEAYLRSENRPDDSALRREYHRELWRNHHLVADMQRVSPELRAVVSCIRDVVAADGIVSRLGEPGFVEELSLACQSYLPRSPSFFEDGFVRRTDRRFDPIVRGVQGHMREFIAEFSAESMAERSPWIDALRRVGYHEGCARIIEARLKTFQ